MGQLVIHSKTEAQLLAFMSCPSNVLLVTGDNGIGKSVLADRIIRELLDLSSNALNEQASVMVVSSAENSISIEKARQISRFLELKTVGQGEWRRAILIEHAELLTVEAQNALLKTLEEPPADSLIILTASSPNALLSTIVSRTSLLSVLAPSQEQLQQFFVPEQAKLADFNKAYRLSGGLPGLLTALLSNGEHPLVEAVNKAKQFLTAEPFERLILADELYKQKPVAGDTLEALTRMARSATTQAAEKGSLTSLDRWQRVLKTAYDASCQLELNAQAV